VLSGCVVAVGNLYVTFTDTAGSGVLCVPHAESVTVAAMAAAYTCVVVLRARLVRMGTMVLADLMSAFGYDRKGRFV
jgi:hypothetical protein